ncbi:MAG: epoxide hydrolase [Candidatus Dormibacteraceae bacterium]
MPTPFTVDIPEAVLADLRHRLARTRWADEPPGESAWSTGTDLDYLRKLTAYWRDGFDWRAQERVLNGFTQFTVPLAGIDLHYIHQPGVGPDPQPLLLSHGWPGSVWEFHDLIPRLTDPARFGGDPADAFTVVAPSLPGFGFSYRPGQPRFGADAMAEVFAELMTDVLGYRRFFAAGGDWGAMITTRLAHVHRDRLKGIHLTLLATRRDPGRPPTASLEDDDYQRQVRHWLGEESGYSTIQATKPQTLAYAMTDSPAGLAAWIVEKFRSWSDCGGDIESRFSRDELLANLTIYWATGAIGSSFWPYYARQHGGWSLSDLVRDGGRIEVPTAYALFPAEILRPSRELVAQAFNLHRFTVMPRGGHFAALEEPDLLAGDLRDSFRALR